MPNKKMLVCPYCNNFATLRDTSIIYGGKSYGKAYICVNYPSCDSYVGVHKGTNRPLGSLAKYTLRELRKKCHKEFDALWKNTKNKKDNRAKCYSFLQKLMNCKKKEAHIGMFNEEQCINLLEKLENNHIKKDLDLKK